MTEEAGITFGTQWLWDPTASVQLVNQLVIQPDVPMHDGAAGDQIYLTFGHLNPPLVIGDVADPQVQAQHDGAVLPITPVARLAVTRERLQEFSEVLSDWLQTTGATEPKDQTESEGRGESGVAHPAQ